MLTVSNSSPLIALAEIGQLDLLSRLFGSIVVPPAVVSEVAPSLPDLPTWVEVRPLQRTPAEALTRRALGPGERDAIALSIELKASRVILDDLLARRIASTLGVPVIGTLGVLVAAKQNRLIDSIRPLVDRLAQGRFFIGEDLYRDLLEMAGEGNRWPK